MSIVYMRPLSGREGDYGKNTEHKKTQSWLAYSDSRYESDYSICSYGWNNNILPVPFVTTIAGVLPLVPLLCRELSVKQDKNSPQHYTITASYSSEPISQADRQQETNPLDKPVTFTWKTNRYNKAIFKDINGQAILNAAGQYFDPPVEIELFRWTVGVVKNVTAVPAYILDFAEGGPINDSDFTIQGIDVGEGIARLVDMNVSELQTATVGDEVIEYYVFAYALEFHREGWQTSLLNQGTLQVNSSNSEERIPNMDNGTPPKPISRPVPLDENGYQISDPSPENAVFIDFDTIFPADFTVLPGINT